ncbi:amino acid adenylation domain-containing protein [Amycolatopsis rubida]|uniref:Amino acid adenylation domain-containing protein n=1 Tax=Amycolatopsis rubida TaxID=112413 RepID=A0ABX0BX54_9PSEU|nr:MULTISPECIES: AMP-binding protein [Amycolatopsis]MYW93807.1 AMP-binding protein [Amycolatopsis rubida]NEC58797.1 amino acid adenylation domain-containing protein [Amycolatopsis rubida]OAP22998.1 Gramicidin S synthase 2 [Amycolatopsis sp. M39]
MHIHDLVTAHAQRTPDRLAVVSSAERITYRDLDARANQLARRLRDRQVRPGDKVGVQIARSPLSVIAALGVLKTGAAYVPLDVDYPPRRVAAMLEQSGSCVVVSPPERRGGPFRLTDLAFREPSGSRVGLAPPTRRCCSPRDRRVPLKPSGCRIERSCA